MEKQFSTMFTTIEHEGNRWGVKYKIFPKRKELRVYRVEGDITTPLLREALELFTQAQALKLNMT